MNVADARRYMRMSAPRTPQVHLIESALGGHLFVADGSRLFDADAEPVRELSRRGDQGRQPRPSTNCCARPALSAAPSSTTRRCRRRRCARCRWRSRRNAISAAPIATPSRASSAVPPRTWNSTEALRAVDLLVATAEPGARLNLAFLGGEPLVNRKVLRAATERAAELAARPRREDHLLDHHQRHAADRGRRALLRGAWFRRHRQHRRPAGSP